MEELFSNTESIVDQPTNSKCFTVPKSIHFAKKKRTVADHQMEFMKTCTQTLSQNTEMSEYDAMEVNVATKLKKMKTKQCIYADFLISKILSKLNA